MDSGWVIVLATGFAAFLSWRFIIAWRSANSRENPDYSNTKVLGVHSPVLGWFRYRTPIRFAVDREKLLVWPITAKYGFEIGLILLWALWLGSAYLDFRPEVYPGGGELWMVTQNHYQWELLKECGACFFWNGNSNGGIPAFVDIHGAWLHPLVSIPTLLAGVVNGTKLTILLSLFTAGVAQWWLAKQIGAGRLARVWTALIATAGGHLAGRMDNGGIPLIVSTVACTWVLAALLNFLQKPHTRSAILLGVTLGLAVLAGQGYLQMGLVFILPSILVAVFISQAASPSQSYLKYLAVIGGLALLISGALLVPFIHFLPNFVKDVYGEFQDVQPLHYIPLNWVIADPAFFRTEQLAKAPYPYINTAYIGWIPVGLALLGLVLRPPQQRLTLIFCLAGIASAVFAASKTPWELLAQIVPQYVLGIRNPSVIAGLAIPLILVLAGIGLEKFWSFRGLRFSIHTSTRTLVGFHLWPLVAVSVLLLSLKSVSDFARIWMPITSIRNLEIVLNELDTESTQWVQTPWGEAFWHVASMRYKYKIAFFGRPWNWRDRSFPAPHRLATRIPEGPTLPGYQKTVDSIHIIFQSENQYAELRTKAGETFPCEAQARGGHITVICPNAPAGTLRVMENYEPSWEATLNGRRAVLPDSRGWIELEMPSGANVVELRFQPWDAPVGLILTSLGLGIAGWLWLRSNSRQLELPAQSLAQNRVKPVT